MRFKQINTRQSLILVPYELRTVYDNEWWSDMEMGTSDEHLFPSVRKYWRRLRKISVWLAHNSARIHTGNYITLYTKFEVNASCTRREDVLDKLTKATEPQGACKQVWSENRRIPACLLYFKMQPAVH